MTAMVLRSILASTLVAATTLVAHAEPLDDTLDGNALAPPSSVVVTPAPAPTPRVVRHDPIATTARWGGSVRLTGLSGIGALPGVNIGGELAGQLRHDQYFGELALGRWKPRETYVVTETPEHVELGLDVWTVRGGWASMAMPLRGWALFEAGELAGPKGMPGVVPRMVMGDVPQNRRWLAAGAGFGVAWPVADMVRLFGAMEIAVPLDREHLALDHGAAYTPDPLVARYSVGLEVGLR